MNLNVAAFAQSPAGLPEDLPKAWLPPKQYEDFIGPSLLRSCGHQYSFPNPLPKLAKYRGNYWYSKEAQCNSKGNPRPFLRACISQKPLSYPSYMPRPSFQV